MKIAYNVFAIFLVSIINTACGQKVSNNHQEKTVTKEQYNAISKEIRTFDYNPTYQLRFTATNCTYEVYINDMLVTFSFTTGNTAGEQHADIPQYILSSGPQEIKVKLYPKAVEDGKLEDKLSANATFNGRIVHGEYGVTDWDHFTQVTSFRIPVPGEKAETEFRKTFDAQVPFSLKGWKSGTDLRKENKAALTEEVREINERFANAFKKADIEQIATMIYNREKEVAQAFFFKSGEPKSYDQGWEVLSDEAAKLASVKVAENVDLRYLAGGKVVALMQTRGEDRDFPAIIGETGESYTYYALYLFRPEPGAPLEIIR